MYALMSSAKNRECLQTSKSFKHINNLKFVKHSEIKFCTLPCYKKFIYLLGQCSLFYYKYVYYSFECIDLILLITINNLYLPPMRSLHSLNHGQTSTNRTKPGPSFQLSKWAFACCTILVLSVQLPNLKLKTQPKQLLVSLPLVITLPD